MYAAVSSTPLCAVFGKANLRRGVIWRSRTGLRSWAPDDLYVHAVNVQSDYLLEPSFA
jgi:hypothetical protein